MLQELVDQGKLSWSGDYNSTKKGKYKVTKDEAWDEKFALFDAHEVDKVTELNFKAWQGQQRKYRRSKKLHPDCISKLDDMVAAGKFTWSLGINRTDDEKWDARFKLLLSYGEEHGGDCNVPTGYISKISHCRKDTSEPPFIEEIRLGIWLSRQRTSRAKGVLRDDRRQRLQKLVDEGKLLWFTGRGPNNDWGDIEQCGDEKANRKRKRSGDRDAEDGSSTSEAEEQDEEDDSVTEEDWVEERNIQTYTPI